VYSGREIANLLLPSSGQKSKSRGKNGAVTGKKGSGPARLTLLPVDGDSRSLRTAVTKLTA
jgi:hypothetical protein